MTASDGPEFVTLGRKQERRLGLGGPLRLGYDVVRSDDPSKVAVAFVVAVADLPDARPGPWSRGWIVYDLDGRLVLGAGASTRIGFGRADALFMLADSGVLR